MEMTGQLHTPATLPRVGNPVAIDWTPGPICNALLCILCQLLCVIFSSDSLCFCVMKVKQGRDCFSE